MRLLTKPEFLARLKKRQGFDWPEIEKPVREIVEDVRRRGDEAVREYTRRFDGVEIPPGGLEVNGAEIDRAYEEVSPEFLRALGQARDNVLAFHQAEKRESWWLPRLDGSLLGQVIGPVARAGIYVPGGSAPLVSSLVMLAIPARVAGVPEIVLSTPPSQAGPHAGRIDPHLLVAARESGVHRAFRVGGAQAIAALAYGTESVPKVDKIAGPGNIYVTIAKKIVYGVVGIEGLMGPSEVAVLAEPGSGADPAWIAADLLSQAEHDPMAASYLITTSAGLARDVIAEVECQLALLPRAGIARKSLQDWGAALVVSGLDEGVEMINAVAPEHLELLVREPLELVGRISSTGAIFCGPWSPEPVGDYLAGPSNVLPTAGTARYASVVSVATFQRETSLINLSRRGFDGVAESILTLAGVEGLEAHARSIKVRMGGKSQ